MRTILTLVAVSVGQLASAYDAPPPMSFAKPTADGKHVLVMLRKQPRADLRDRNPVEKKYERSGLYPVNDPTKPVWTCDWSADWERSVVAANDTVHAVRLPDTDPGLRRWLLGFERPRGNIPAKPVGLDATPAISLYANGKLLKTVTLGEAFDCSDLTDVDCHAGPVIALDGFEDATGRVWISIDGERGRQAAIIDIKTGAVTQRMGVGATRGRCGNDESGGGFFGLGGDSVDGRQRLGFALLSLLVAAVTLGGVFVLVAIWRKRPEAED